MSTLKATNIKNESSASNNIVLDSGGGAIFSGVTTFSSSVNFNNVDSLNLGTGTTISSPASNTFIVSTNGSERIRVDSLGDVGIGTTNPQYTLDVAGDINLTGTFRQNGSTFVASRWTSGIGDDIYRLNGDVGIGTTNPTTALQINGVLGFNNTNTRIGGNTTGASITSGTNNNFIGVGAGYITNTGSSNNFIGINAGFSNQNGSSNNFLGSGSGYTNTSGTGNNFFGLNAGFSNQSGNSNNFIGVAAGISNQTGSNNIFLGARNGISASASYKVIIGSGYLANYFDSPNTTKDYQFAVGIRTDANASKYWLVGDENFNVGIGTTNPTTPLQVVGIVSATSYRGDGSQLSGISVGTDITSCLFT